MKQDIKIFISIIIIIIGIFFIAKSSDVLSAWVVESKLNQELKQINPPDLTKITITPETVKQGESIFVEIIPGKGGVRPYAYLNEITPGPDRLADDYRFCRHESQRCTEPKYEFKYRIPASTDFREGNYYIDIVQRSTELKGEEIIIREFFTIEPYQEN